MRSATRTSSRTCARRRPRSSPAATDLTEAVARYYFKLLAIKDEYEVARLYAETDFAQRVAAQFEGDYKLRFHLAPPTLNKPDPQTGEPKKSTYGPWMMPAFRVLAKLRRLPRRRARHLRQDRRAPAGARADRASTRRSSTRCWRADAAELRAGRFAGVDSRAHPRLRAREGSPPEGREGARGRAARAFPRRARRGDVRESGGRRRLTSDAVSAPAASVARDATARDGDARDGRCAPRASSTQRRAGSPHSATRRFRSRKRCGPPTRAANPA